MSRRRGSASEASVSRPPTTSSACHRHRAGYRGRPRRGCERRRPQRRGSGRGRCDSGLATQQRRSRGRRWPVRRRPRQRAGRTLPAAVRRIGGVDVRSADHSGSCGRWSCRRAANARPIGPSRMPASISSNAGRRSFSSSLRSRNWPGAKWSSTGDTEPNGIGVRRHRSGRWPPGGCGPRRAARDLARPARWPAPAAPRLTPFEQSQRVDEEPGVGRVGAQRDDGVGRRGSCGFQAVGSARASCDRGRSGCAAGRRIAPSPQ